MTRSVLLLNLPFFRPLQRDYGCPHGVKADYYWPPIDLLMFGAMSRGAASVRYLDAVAGRLSADATLDRVVELQPDVVFTIVSSISIESDRDLLMRIKERLPHASVWASGDVVFFGTDRFDGVDVYVRDLTHREAVREFLLQGAVTGEIGAAPGTSFRVGICPHELTQRYRYAMPYSLHPRITTVLTNYGCPFQCGFCNSREFPFKTRELDEVVEELAVIQSLGIREIVFRDFTLNASDVDALCDEIALRGIRLAWSCWTRIDLVNRRILEKMKHCGCYLVSYGVESGENDVLQRVGKNTRAEQAREVIALTKGLGLEVLASYILGFPGESPEGTISSVFQLDPDYLSLNLLSARYGSAWATEAAAQERMASRDSLIAEDREAMAVRDATERRFYLRPSKVLRYARLCLKSRWRFLIFLRSGFGLLRRWWSQRRGSARRAGRHSVR